VCVSTGPAAAGTATNNTDAGPVIGNNTITQTPAINTATPAQLQVNTGSTAGPVASGYAPLSCSAAGGLALPAGATPPLPLRCCANAVPRLLRSKSKRGTERNTTETSNANADNNPTSVSPTEDTSDYD
jgi:hypothetical protein